MCVRYTIDTMFLFTGLAFFVSLFIAVAGLVTAICRDASHFGGIDPVRDQGLGYAFFIRLYFVMTTLTTIGFGDVTPVSIRAKTVVMFIIFTFVVVLLKALDTLRSTVVGYIPGIESRITSATSQVARFKNKGVHKDDASTF